MCACCFTLLSNSLLAARNGADDELRDCRGFDIVIANLQQSPMSLGTRRLYIRRHLFRIASLTTLLSMSSRTTQLVGNKNLEMIKMERRQGGWPQRAVALG